MLHANKQTVANFRFVTAIHLIQLQPGYAQKKSRTLMLLNKRYWIMSLIQSVTACIALLMAWSLRFEFSLPHLGLLLMAAPILTVIRWLTMSYFSLSHGYWRFTGISDAKDLVKALLAGSLSFFIVVRLVLGIVSFPLSIYFMEGALTLLLLAGMRVASRLLLQAKYLPRTGERTPVLVVGAGAAAALLLQELERINYLAVGLVDDNSNKQHTKLCGVRVRGKIDQLPALAQRLGAREILIAIPSATGEQMLRITELCSRTGLPFRAVPSLANLIEGRVTISELRPIDLDDLLGREPVCLESENVLARLRGRVVMVTGAAGSIGSELCKQIVRCRPAKLICVDRAETPLFHLQQHTLRNARVDVIYSVADITDTANMRRQLIEHEVQAVFHCAAHKHVPMTELNPYEGLQNNVFGLLALVEAADDCGCEDFLLISTDKAVKPSSLMGCTKRLGEMIVGARDSRMRCVSVRFGNVLGSQGSVIPLFQEQIRTQRRVTVTHAEMTRYFMTIPEAVSLVLQAYTVGEHGDILVLDMGKPVRILDLAKTLIRISGKSESEVDIVFTGTRPGEKLHEELFYDSEVRLATALPKVMRAQSALPAWPVLSRKLHELYMLPFEDGADRVRAKIKQIIPEYQWEPSRAIEDVKVTFAIYPSGRVRLQEKSRFA
jgi:FlaA1/EpsC-like NDP-sugar epimerase